MGIIGLGKVGGRVALRAKAFEMDVLACDPYIAEKRAEDLGVKLVPLEDIIRFADVITVHTPLNEETRGMIGAEHFRGMKDGVMVVNCARGGIIDEAAMLEALEGGKAAGAAFDVWSEEPPDTEILRKLIAHPRMVVTPHLGANTFEAQKNVAVDVSREIVNYLDGRPLENAVNIPKFDPDLMEHMKPFMALVAKIGEFISQLAPPNPNKVTFTYNGKLARYDCAPLTVAGLAALLNCHTEQEVNMVNARLVAKNMGIDRGGGSHHRVRILLQHDHPEPRNRRRGGAPSPAPSSRGYRRSSRCVTSSPISLPRSTCWLSPMPTSPGSSARSAPSWERPASISAR